jgi:hypothetical protein
MDDMDRPDGLQQGMYQGNQSPEGDLKDQERIAWVRNALRYAMLFAGPQVSNCMSREFFWERHGGDRPRAFEKKGH